MKSLILVRHAKSSWDNSLQQDFDRPLNERGIKDAPKIARRLLEKNIWVDAFISSPAKRAFETCMYFAEAYKRKEKDIIQKQELYLPSVNAFYDVISKLDNDFSTVAVFTHNPGITDFANQLTDVKIDNIPTCGIYAVKVKTKKWKEFADAEKKFWFFDYPKKD